MFGFIARLIARFLVLVPGILITLFAVRELFPTINRRLPLGLAIFVTYLLIAYVLIPVAFRLIRIFIKPRHIPLYCTTPDGFANDPINIGVVGTKAQLIKVMKAAGWYQADPRTLSKIIKMGLSILRRQPYNNAPFSSLYLFGRSQDIGFQLPVDNSILHRHHVRFWASTYTNNPAFRDHVHFWQKHHVSSSTSRILWVGAVSLDKGLGPIRHNAQITHMIHPDTNAERTFLKKALVKTGRVKTTRTLKVGKPSRLRNRVVSGYMHTDGKIVICELKDE